MVERPLFEGAMVCRMPGHWRDVSNIRQVPDHQECWQDVTDDSDASSSTGAVLIIEILELQSSVDADHAAEYFFRDLADANGCDPVQHLSSFRADEPMLAASSFLAVSVAQEGLPMDAVVCAASGDQRVPLQVGQRETDAADARPTPDFRTVHIRLCVLRLPEQTTDLLITLSTPIEEMDNVNPPSAELFRHIISTLRIRDWSLFG